MSKMFWLVIIVSVPKRFVLVLRYPSVQHLSRHISRCAHQEPVSRAGLHMINAYCLECLIRRLCWHATNHL